MNKRRTIYRGFNKRRKTRVIQITALGISICLLGGVIFVKVKNMDIFNKIGSKISSIDLGKFNKSEELNYNDVAKEIEEISKEKEAKKEESIDESQVELTEDVKVAVIDGWSLNTIQVASIQNEADMPKIESQLTENKIPFSVVEIDGVKKVHTYAFFNQDNAREHIEEVKKVFPDAFLSQMKVPVLSLEYTNKYSYVESISNKLNDLIKNFEEESKFWASSTNSVEVKEYNKVLTSRKEILEEIKKEANKIDYENMSVFKDNLIKYLDETNEKIDTASKAANEKNYNVSKSLYLSAMQGYFLFINSIKEA